MKSTILSALIIFSALVANAGRPSISPAGVPGSPILGLPGAPEGEPGPDIVVPPPQALGAGAREIARLMLDPRMADCVKDAYKHDIALDKITRQRLAPNLTQYVLTGVTLLGGDAAIGKFKMVISEEIQTQLGFGGSTITCKITEESFH